MDFSSGVFYFDNRFQVKKHMTEILFQRPLISIILPAYDRLRYLPRCIDSISVQTVKDWELIIVDDGSTDGTADYGLKRISQDPRIRYMAHANRKQALTKNAGIQASFGTYLTFIDSDDAYRPHHLESRLAVFEKDPLLDILEGGFEAPADMKVPDYFNTSQSLPVSECVLGTTFFGKRNVFFELGGFQNLSYGEDTDFWLRAEKKFRVRKITDPKTYVYACTPDGITQSRLKSV
jgi:glycosyltransferase involved in cell wall biosynthesis